MDGVGGGGGDRLEQGVEAIALGSTPLAEPDLGEHFLVAARPDVSFAGGPGGWLAVWASTPWDNYPAVMAARVGTDGALLDRPAFTLTPQPDVPGYAGVGAALGDRWITINGSDNRLATVPATGVPVVTRLTQPGAPPPPEDGGGCDVGGVAGARSRSPLLGSLSPPRARPRLAPPRRPEPRRVPSARRDRQREHAAHADGALRPHPAAVRLDDALHDGEPARVSAMDIARPTPPGAFGG